MSVVWIHTRGRLAGRVSLDFSGDPRSVERSHLDDDDDERKNKLEQGRLRTARAMRGLRPRDCS